jgi:UDP-3-O-acyl-N-acetylglucosamine deacetylase
VPRERRTAIERHGVVVEMVEHVMAALAGLGVDNCIVEVNAPEPPGLDGSCRGFTDALLSAGVVELNELRPVLLIERPLRINAAEQASQIEAAPLHRPTLAITYQLDYGPKSPIRPQQLTVEISPESFLAELAYARTFVLDTEVAALRAQGYGRRTTYRDLLVFGPDGVIENRLHAPDECARHKLLDCLGDLALMGCDVCGHIRAYRSGHGLNREMARRLLQTHAHITTAASRRAA